MRRMCIRHLAAACAVAVQAGIVLAQGVFHFEDNFNRDAWDNAQTNIVWPGWSEPGYGGYVVPQSTATTGDRPFVGEVVVTGSHFEIKGDGQVWLTFDDPDLQVGSVGVMSWGQKATGAVPSGGSRWRDFTVLDGEQQTVFSETWQTTPWKVIAPKQSNGAAASAAVTSGNFRWDFLNNAIIEDSDLFVRPTAGMPTTDFIGATVVYTGAGANDWTEYRVRTRMVSNDDDGFGLIVHCYEDDNTISFYRVHFCGIQIDAANRRPVRGLGVQKAVITKGTDETVWTSLLDSTDFVFDPNKPFDVSVTVQNPSASETTLLIEVINDAVANPTPIAPFNVSDTSSPIQKGTVGFTSWAINVGRWSNYGGVSQPFVQTLDATPATLLGDIFTGPYNNWITTMSGTPAGGNKTLQKWSMLLAKGDLMENSDGRQGDSAGGDGLYTPFILVKSGFSSGPNYTVRATMVTDDNDGMGIIFGYVDNENYFRAGFRNESPATLGFPTGISVQKVVGGVTTPLGVSVGRGPRSNLAGIWLQKFATGTLEMADNANTYDGGHDVGVEFLGPRLVRGDANWTDYTWETVIEARDNDGIGLLFRYQDEKNFYRLTFQSEAQTTAGAPPAGISLQRVVDGAYSELFRDIDPTKSGDNDIDSTAGFIYSDVQSAIGYQIWRPRIVATGGTFRIEIDAILTDGTEYPNYYLATVTDPTPLTRGKVGIHTWGHNANEFRDFRLTLAGHTQPEFFDGHNNADPKGWTDATVETMSDPASIDGEDAGSAGTAAGTPISGFGVRVDLNALGVRDNRYKSGTGQDANNLNAGTVDFDGPRAVVGSLGWADYTYSADLKTFDDDGLGLVFRYRNEDNFYRLMFMSQNGNNLGPPPRGVSAQKRLNGTFSKIFWSGDGGDNFIYTPGERWRVDLTAQGSSFTVKVTQLDGDVDRDGRTEYNFAFSDPSDPILAGKVGVTSWGSKGQANEVNTLRGGAPGLDWTQNFSESGVFDNIIVEGTLTGIAPDLNSDTFIDTADFQLWSACFTGPEIPLVEPTETCSRSDLDTDGDVDQADFGLFQRCFSGTGRTFDPHCVDWD